MVTTETPVSQNGHECCQPSIDELIPLERLRADLRDAAVTLPDEEARYMVDAYYSIQKERVRAGNRITALRKTREPHRILVWQWDQMRILEANTKRTLDVYSNAHLLGRWARSHVGIGPVLAAGLLAHIEIKHTKEDGTQEIINTAGKVWRFAGLDPTSIWKKGEKRPWNNSLKVVCWKIGEQFKMRHNNPGCFYGQFYASRKQLEVERNLSGVNQEASALRISPEQLKAHPLSKDTVAYKALSVGRLPDAQLDLRAMRYAVKIFLSHYHHVAYEIAMGTPPPKPFVIDRLGHQGYVQPPNWPMA